MYYHIWQIYLSIPIFLVVFRFYLYYYYYYYYYHYHHNFITVIIRRFIVQLVQLSLRSKTSISSNPTTDTLVQLMGIF
jgi:hypothetical protein